MSIRTRIAQVAASLMATSAGWRIAGRQVGALSYLTTLARSQRQFAARRRAAARATDGLMAASAGSQVRSGPFSGMRYIDTARGSSLAPKVIGSYEHELHPAIERALRDCRPDRVVDVGCAEGYYAVGLAARLPGVPVFAYDTDPLARQACSELATANGLSDRVTIGETCTPGALADALSGRSALVIVDCEGAEAELVTDAVAAAGTGSVLVIELHEFLVPGVTAQLALRLCKTHDLELVAAEATERTAEAYAARFPEISAVDMNLLVWEERPTQMHWLVCFPRAVPAAKGQG